MTVPRKRQVSLADTRYYHCTSRCVRRAFLCGQDSYSGRSYEHRRQWLVDRLRLLTSVFAIDLCAYAIMHNHYHVILQIDSDRAQGWTHEEVIARWTQLYRAPEIVKRFKEGEALGTVAQQAVSDFIELWRKRLSDLSWFMGALNETIARQANGEDQCKGRFWEGRFKSQALLDEAALLTCMTYVDLNPIRAGIADTPETSDFTSIQHRLREWAQQQANHNGLNTPQKKEPVHDRTNSFPGLLPFVSAQCSAATTSLPFTSEDYFELVDWTGRAIRDNKTGAIPAHLAPILKRLDINPDAWLTTVKHCSRRFPWLMGKIDRLQDVGNKLGYKWLRCLSASRALYHTTTTQME